jgi:hypothetical protein
MMRGPVPPQAVGPAQAPFPYPDPVPGESSKIQAGEFCPAELHIKKKTPCVAAELVPQSKVL